MKKLLYIFVSVGLLSAVSVYSYENFDTLCRRTADFYMANQYEQAEACYKKCLELVPDKKKALYKIGDLCNDMGEFDKAQNIFEHIYFLNPSERGVGDRLWVMYLRNQDWQRGSQLRKNLLNQGDHWWYDADIKGKTVLLYYYAGHGIGDIINYGLYAKKLADAGAHVFIQARHELKPLFSLCPYVKQYFSLQEQAPKVDIEYRDQAGPVLRMISNHKKSGSDAPYLYADEQLVSYWKEKLSEDKNFKIGLCWKDAGSGPRSIPLTKLERLKNIPGISFYNLQKFNGKRDLQNKGADFIVHDFDDSFDVSHGRLMDTAALMKNLDLVISVDTGIAHLAGALGVPVWTLLIRKSCFRWLKNRTDSLWYPTMRLFKQKKLGGWDGVVDEVASALQDMVLNRGVRT